MGRRKSKRNDAIEEAVTESPEPKPVVDAEPDEPAAPVEVKVVDKRRFARLLGFGGQDDPPDDGRAEDSDSRLPSYVEELKRRVEAAESASRDEVEAARTRLERHFESRLVTARAEMAAGLLDVLDNLDRALGVPGAADSPLYEGIATTRDLFIRKLADMGIEPVPGVGEPFDPESHEALDSVGVEDEAMDGRIAEVLQRGFRTSDRLVRPAFVRVGRWHG